MTRLSDEELDAEERYHETMQGSMPNLITDLISELKSERERTKQLEEAVRVAREALEEIESDDEAINGHPCPRVASRALDKLRSLEPAERADEGENSQ